jgi:hypothetical protein
MDFGNGNWGGGGFGGHTDDFTFGFGGQCVRLVVVRPARAYRDLQWMAHHSGRRDHASADADGGSGGADGYGDGGARDHGYGHGRADVDDHRRADADKYPYVG